MKITKTPAIIKNSLPVIGSLLTKLQENFTLWSVQQFEITGTPRQKRQQAKRLINDWRLCMLEVLNKDSVSRHLTINLNRKPENIVSCWSHDEDLIEAVEEFKKQWSGKSWPNK